MEKSLAPDGYLIVGSTESLAGICAGAAHARHANRVRVKRPGTCARRVCFGRHRRRAQR